MNPSPSPAVSVVIPTFERATTLGRALRSVLAQTRPPDEVVVVDDGSTDGTGELVGREFPGVRYLLQANRGVSAARNRGISAAGGEWIAFLDSDDEWRPEKLERQLAAVAAAPGYLLCHTDEIWIRAGRRVNPRAKHAKAGGWIFERSLALCAISPSAALVHRRLFGEVGLFDEELAACEDYDLWLRVTCRYPVLFVDEPLVVKHGGHADQLSRRVWGLDRFRILALEKLLAGDGLAERDRRLASAELRRRLAIFLAGAEKRGRVEGLARFRELAKRFAGPAVEAAAR